MREKCNVVLRTRAVVLSSHLSIMSAGDVLFVLKQNKNLCGPNVMHISDIFQAD